MKIVLKPLFLSVAVASALTGCNSDSLVADPTRTSPGGTDVTAPTDPIVGRYSFDSKFSTNVQAYSSPLDFEITDQNGARFISDAINIVVDRDLQELRSLTQARLTNNSSSSEEKIGLEPLFDSGFEQRSSNCKAGGKLTISVKDKPLNFAPNEGDTVKTSFQDCARPIDGQTNAVNLQTGGLGISVALYKGRFGDQSQDASAQFSDTLDTTSSIVQSGETTTKFVQTGQVDYAANRTLDLFTSFTSSELRKTSVLDEQDKPITEISESFQREYRKTAALQTIRFQSFQTLPDPSSQNELKASKYSSEEGRTQSPSTPIKVGLYSSSSDPYHPDAGAGSNLTREGLTEGGMVSFGKNGQIELVFNQEPVQSISNIVRVIKTIGGQVTHDCKVPYYSVYRTNSQANPRFSFAPEGKCLVDNMSFPPTVTPPPPPPPAPSCFLSDVIGTVQDNDPSPVSGSLFSALSPVTAALCSVISPIQSQITP